MREALATLSKTGEADFTLRSLARRIGVSHAAPYAHFPTKAALLAEIAAVGFEALNARVVAASNEAAALGPRARFLAAGRAGVRFGLANPGLYRLMFGAELGAESFTYPKFKQAGQAAFETLVAHVRALRPHDDGAAATAAWSMLHGLTTLLLDDRIHRGGTADRGEAIEKALAVLVAGIEAG